MTGTVYLGGGGSAFDEEALWRLMLPERRRIVYWPFALPPERLPAARASLVSSLDDLHLDAEVEVWATLRDRRPEQLTRGDLLFVGGGNTFRLLQEVRRHGFVEAVAGFVRDGGDYYGGSAGAVLAGADIRIADGLDENEPGLSDLGALPLVDAFTVLPYYDDSQQATARAWCRTHGRTLLGVPERSGVVVRDGWAEVVGAAVTEVDAAGVRLRGAGDRWAVGSL